MSFVPEYVRVHRALVIVFFPLGCCTAKQLHHGEAGLLSSQARRIVMGHRLRAMDCYCTSILCGSPSGRNQTSDVLGVVLIRASRRRAHEASVPGRAARRRQGAPAVPPPGHPLSPPCLTVRSRHLLRDHTAAAVSHHASDRCSLCGCGVLNEVGSGEYTAEERR